MDHERTPFFLFSHKKYILLSFISAPANSVFMDQFFNQLLYEGGGTSQFCGKGPISCIISLWQDQTSLIASGVPIPAPLGSPAGPNLQC